MNLIKEIRECFATREKGAIAIKSLKEPYEGWYINTSEGYGVAIPCNNDEEISEYFNKCKIQNRYMTIDSQELKVLLLTCVEDEYFYEFATICAEFLDPGDNGNARCALVDNPLKWWGKWKELIGNKSNDERVYNVLAEMLAYEALLKEGEKVEWLGPEAGTHDLEGEKNRYEVKSTKKKYGTTITVSSQYQMESNEKLYLYFCRLEESQIGDSINDLCERLLKLGCNKNDLEQKLSKLGLERGRSARKEKYKILEKKKYIIDEDFPKIVKESFKNNRIPDRIVQLTYTVDLEGLEYSNW